MLPRYWLLATFVAGGLALRAAAFAADPRFPDWPCAQLKVPEISIAAVWSGPSIDALENVWQTDPAVRDLVARSAIRRTPLEDAQTEIRNFIARSADRQETAKLTFAGLFVSLNAERSQVINGIERFSRHQEAFANRIREEIAELRRLRDADANESEIDEVANRIDWDTRIFEERRKTIRYACEVPVLIEQRLFALARTIQESLESAH
jgi:Rad3-related DNA helicase